MKPDRPRRRALLVASVGVATVSYALQGCGKSHPPGNLAQPIPAESVPTPVAGNLAAEPPPTVDAAPPPPIVDAGATTAAKTTDAGAPPLPPTTVQKPVLKPPTSGNLMAPR